jgi:hypothetical protein
MGRFEAALQTLELDQFASGEEIKQAYKDLVIVWHPDRFLHNPRLRQKAEEKLKCFNQAYEQLKGWQQAHSAHSPTAACSHRPSATSRRSGGRSTRASANSLCISLTDAAFILQHYHFEPLDPAHQPQRQYQGGPFVLVVCDAPPEVMISVPCNTLQQFDQILLSIPCKSTGHFIHQEAEQLLQLLYTPGET